MNGVMGASRIQPALVARSTGRLHASNGCKAHSRLDFAFEEFEQPDIVCVPDLFIAPEDSLQGRYETETRWIRRWYESRCRRGNCLCRQPAAR